MPEQYTSQAERDLTARTERKGILTAEVLSFGRLAHQFFAKNGLNRAVILGDVGKQMALQKILLEQQDDLPYFCHMTEIRQVILLFQENFLQCHLFAHIPQYHGSVQSVFGKKLVCQSAEAEDFRCQDAFALCSCCQVAFRLRGVLLRHQKNLPSFVRCV